MKCPYCESSNVDQEGIGEWYCHDCDIEFERDDLDLEPDESMDGDFDSGMASAGHGMDEDYRCDMDYGDY